MKFGVVQFPGSNCDYDCYYSLKYILKVPTGLLWHKETNITGYDCIVLPGGFSYGDYLRVGAIARYAPVMRSILDFAREGGLVIGICNGFQILTEARLLPGSLIRNNCLHFTCKWQYIRVENINTPVTNLCQKEQVLKIPIAHGEGCYYADQNTIDEIEANNQVLFRYCSNQGKITQEANPNGSLYNIAGICNKGRNIFGLMPHPERCMEDCLGSIDGRLIFKSVINYLRMDIFPLNNCGNRSTHLCQS
ncbi:MAG: phosphoribosylformylglycinamidine synthase subunit PurQ [Atribacterota bacterium]|nr:phosphoribosylformylglycinamidine synthase subunit PurQ [Atribacterota bacterium]MDD4896601.1 phosphoribosylformylglycinamidine synthase subunit PurQ [Atribacterota bacterium]MDD5637466.1 phosphoribosylformylglycinamidine synthase subunit PurQ [Atribacterota bacterium]